MSDIPSNGASYQFAGPTATVTTAAGQRMTGAATSVLGKTSTGTDIFRYGLCYQLLSGGSIINFVGSNYTQTQMDNVLRQDFSAAASTVPGAGTWKVGFCTFNVFDIDNNDYVNGWVMVSQ